MSRISSSIVLLALLSAYTTQSQQVSTPAAQFIAVEPGVKLEVLDLGGSGRNIVLLAGLGGTAHSFGSFAADLTRKYHVYGITRRGYGASDAPPPSAENYSADRLGDDVLAVLDAVKLDHPILVGHSLAGEELSSIGSRHPERVAGLVYLDAGNRYALAAPGRGDFQLDTITMRQYLTAILNSISAADQQKAIEDFERELPAFQQDLDTRKKEIAVAPVMSAERHAALAEQMKTPQSQIEHAILFNERRYTTINCPILTIFPSPHDYPALQGQALATAEAKDEAYIQSQAKLFRALPNAKVVLIPHARHDVFASNEAEVLHEIDAFVAGLP